MVTSSDPRSPIAEIVASISALRRSGSIPTFGILNLLPAKYFLLTDQSTKIHAANTNFALGLYEARRRIHFGADAARIPASGEKDDCLHRGMGAFALR
jgi:hypothetical protein